jgi:hypothetical protein
MPHQPNLDLGVIFPIRDQASAWLMCFKADCLHRAGVITETQRQQVHQSAAVFHAQAA